VVCGGEEKRREEEEEEEGLVMRRTASARRSSQLLREVISRSEWHKQVTAFWVELVLMGVFLPGELEVERKQRLEIQSECSHKVPNVVAVVEPNRALLSLMSSLLMSSNSKPPGI